jgi:hypothetical protein
MSTALDIMLQESPEMYRPVQRLFAFEEGQLGAIGYASLYYLKCFKLK